MDSPERDLAGLDEERPLPPGLARRLEAAVLGADGAGSRARDAGLAETATLFRSLDAPRAMPASTRAAIERTLIREPAAYRAVARRPRLLTLAAAVLLVVGSVAALSWRPAGHSKTEVVAGPPAPSTAPEGKITAGTVPAPAPDFAPAQAASPVSTATSSPSPGNGGAGAPGGAAASPMNPQSLAAESTVTSVDPPSGPMKGGTTVSVKGAGLSGATAVAFGSSPAGPFTVVSDTEIQAVSPAASRPGPVMISVSFPDGRISRAGPGDHFTYNATPSTTTLLPGVTP